MTTPRVLVVCHNPTERGQGDIKWEGHEIVQYVDVTEPGKVKKCDRDKYTCGWDSLGSKPELMGTIDKVFAPYCPIFAHLGETAYPEPLTIDKIGTIDNDLFVKAFSYLKPGGVLLLPWEDGVLRADSKKILEDTFGSGNVKIGRLDTPTVPVRSPATIPSEFDVPYIQITKAVGGGRRKTRRRTRRSTKKRSTLSVRS